MPADGSLRAVLGLEQDELAARRQESRLYAGTKIDLN